MASSAGDRFLRQLSASNGCDYDTGCGLQQEYGGGGRRGSRRWSKKRAAAARGYGVKQGEASAARKRVMVVVDESSGAKHAMMWALTHVASKGDFLTLIHVLPPQSGGGGGGGGADASALANSLGALCKACKPEVRAQFFYFWSFAASCCKCYAATQ